MGKVSLINARGLNFDKNMLKLHRSQEWLYISLFNDNNNILNKTISSQLHFNSFNVNADGLLTGERSLEIEYTCLPCSISFV